MKTGYLTPYMQALYEIQNGKCFLCFQPMTTCRAKGKKSRKDGFTIDHVMPKSRGGEDHPDNKVMMHEHCNIEKGNRLPTIDELQRLAAINTVRHLRARAIIADKRKRKAQNVRKNKIKNQHRNGAVAGKYGKG